jgi:hypothetical protein
MMTEIQEAPQTPVVPEAEPAKPSARGGMLSWKLTEAQLAEQTEQYETLGWTKSWRKLSVLLLGAVIVVSVAGMGLFGLTAEDVLYSGVLYGVLAFFIYRGHRWAMLGAMGLWTLEKALQVVTEGAGAGLISIVLFWYVFVQVFWKAYQVERQRHERATADAADPETPESDYRGRGAFFHGVVGAVIAIAAIGLVTALSGEGLPDELPDLTPEEIVSQADYDEGYKAGYADGRAQGGEFMDSYAPPATTEREESYGAGYLDGFLVGCDEGGFDCSAIEEHFFGPEGQEAINADFAI